MGSMVRFLLSSDRKTFFVDLSCCLLKIHLTVMSISFVIQVMTTLFSFSLTMGSLTWMEGCCSRPVERTEEVTDWGQVSGRGPSSFLRCLSHCRGPGSSVKVTPRRTLSLWTRLWVSLQERMCEEKAPFPPSPNTWMTLTCPLDISVVPTQSTCTASSAWSETFPVNFDGPFPRTSSGSKKFQVSFVIYPSVHVTEDSFATPVYLWGRGNFTQSRKGNYFSFKNLLLAFPEAYR